MYTNVNLAAPLGALAFLGTAFLLLVAGLALIYSLLRKKYGLTKFALAIISLLVAVYLAVVMIFSLASVEKVIGRGQEKHFCEIDCHIAYSVADVRETKTLGDPPNQITAAGNFHVITIKSRFDETTISPNRGNEPLHPNSRVATLTDQNGHEYFPSAEAEATLDKSHSAGVPMSVPLRPGESYSSVLVFDLPDDIQSPTLLIREGEWLTHLVIGHENSPFHKKTRFQL